MALPEARGENIGHHFVVDPTAFDFYAMDCYRQLAEDKMAGHLAEEALRAFAALCMRSVRPQRTGSQ